MEERLESLYSLRRAIRAAAGSALLLAAVLIAYWPAMRDGGWIWDDDAHVTNNPALRNPDGLRKIWTNPKAVPTHQYYPLVHTTFWLQYPRDGSPLDPMPFHVANVLLHATSAIVLWQLLRKLLVPGAFVAAAIWALHPINVESVAWVTERKNVLSGLLYLLAAAAYLRFEDIRNLNFQISNPKSKIQNPDSPWPWYAWALVLFLGALFSKTVASSLPAALLLVFWWKRGRLDWRTIWPTIPFFVLGATMGLLTSILETHPDYVGASGAEWTIPWLHRLLIAGRAIWFYPWKLIVPTQLAFSYEQWRIDPRVVGQWVYLFAAIWLVGILYFARRWLGRGPIVAMLFYGGTILPALGLFTLFPMRYTFVADHYQYMAGIGLIALAVAASTSRLTRLPRWAAQWPLSVCVLTILAGLTWQQSKIYENAETLWTDTLAKNDSSWLARHHLARIYIMEHRQFDRAVELCERNVRDLPRNEFLLSQYAEALDAAGRADKARDVYHHLLSLYPAGHATNHKLAVMYLKTGQIPEAVRHFREELRVNSNPDQQRMTRSGLADALMLLGLNAEAEEELWQVVRGDVDNVPSRVKLANLLLARGERAQAVQLLRDVRRLEPGLIAERLKLARELHELKRYTEAVLEFDRILRLDPDNLDARAGRQNALVMLNRVDP